jgi:hypothetical protein
VWVPGDLTSAELLGFMRYLEPSRDICAADQYNNFCYNVAALRIERLSGQSYEAIRARLIDRLRITVSFTLGDLQASAGAAGVPDRLLPDRFASEISRVARRPIA